jgi:sulfur carrier protein ThiS
MDIQVKCYATLARHQPENGERFSVEPETSVADLAGLLGITPEAVKVVFVNGRHVDQDCVLAEGDRVAFFPAVGGG